jgi:site-specific recombinase XerD
MENSEQAKDSVIKNILLDMNSRLDGDTMRDLENVLCSRLCGYDVILKKESVSDLAVADKTDDARSYQMFFIAKKIEGLSDRSLGYYKLEIDALLTFCRKPLGTVAADDVRYYLATRGPACSNRTLDNKRRVLSSFFTWLASEGRIDRNPMLRVKVIRTGKQVKKAFSEEETELLRDACKNKRETAVVDLLLSTGMRCGELCGLNVTSVDFSNSEITVLGKGNKERVCYMNPKAKLHLADYLAERKDNNPALFLTTPSNSMTNPGRMSVSAVEGLVRRIGKRAGVKNVHPHRFRRTAATIALNRGMPIDQVQQLLGHEQIATTMIYAMAARDSVKTSHSKFLS